MKIRSASFIKSGTRPAHFPPADLPEIAFAGRSNVGKSSLMNTLVQRKGLVKVSGTPGRTQLLSWFDVNHRLMLCDLPGYGFARVPAHVRRNWGTMIDTYFATRANLLALAVLTDVRRGFEDDDRQLIDAAAQLGLHVILVATKCDRIKPNALFNRKAAIAKDMSLDPKRDIIWFSSKTGAGREALWRRIDTLLPSVDEAE